MLEGMAWGCQNRALFGRFAKFLLCFSNKRSRLPRTQEREVFATFLHVFCTFHRCFPSLRNVPWEEPRHGRPSRWDLVITETHGDPDFPRRRLPAPPGTPASPGAQQGGMLAGGSPPPGNPLAPSSPAAPLPVCSQHVCHSRPKKPPWRQGAARAMVPPGTGHAFGVCHAPLCCCLPCWVSYQIIFAFGGKNKYLIVVMAIICIQMFFRARIPH